MAVDEYPTETDYDWMVEGTNEVSITIEHNHPKYCEKCKNTRPFLSNP